eukprot:1401654-Pleurochrysis_carterae.AAC.1
MAAQVSGIGMCAYLARAALGGGPNFVLTMLLLAIQQVLQVANTLLLCPSVLTSVDVMMLHS